MQHTFQIEICPYTGTAKILLNTRSLASQSQLRVCCAENFVHWYQRLPGLLYEEVNDIYDVRLTCLELEYRLLEPLFSSTPECRKVVQMPVKTNYSMENRVAWLLDAAQDLGIPLAEVPSFSLQALPDAAGVEQSIRGQLGALYEKHCSQTKQPVNLWLASWRQLPECVADNDVAGDLILVIVGEGEGNTCGMEPLWCPVIRASREEVAGLIEQWVDLMLLAPYLLYGKEKLTRGSQSLSFLNQARLQMLTRDEPIVKSKMPDRIECGTSVNIELEEFPPGNLLLQVSDPAVLRQQGNQLTAGKAGAARVEVLSESGAVVMEQEITVYVVNRVRIVQLMAPGGTTVLEGETFVVAASLTPSDAVNRNKAVWLADAGLKNLGGGRFKALAAGTYTVTLAVELVRDSITVRVMALPRDIRMASELTVRVNKTTAHFHATLLPAGSGCQGIDVRMGDSHIARWDQSKKEVIPVAEGETELVVSAYDAAGQIVVQKKCKVEVLPEEEIITPPLLLTLMIACAVLAFLTAHTLLYRWILWLGLGLSLTVTGQNGFAFFYPSMGKKNKNLLIAGIIGMLIFAVALIE